MQVTSEVRYQISCIDKTLLLIYRSAGIETWILCESNVLLNTEGLKNNIKVSEFKIDQEIAFKKYSCKGLER